MKIATYNIQNIFHRHIDLVNMEYRQKFEFWKDEFESLLKKQYRKDSDFLRMRELAYLMRLHNLALERTKTVESDFFNRFQPVCKARVISDDWRATENTCTVPIPLKALANKIKVISDNNPDVLLLQEVESRASLIKLNELIYKEKLEPDYREIIHLDGNGGNGLGMGIMLKDGYRIRAIQSFSSERDIDGSFLFTNDLQSYKVETPIGQFIYILCVQLSSDSVKENIEKRTRQAKLVSEEYEKLRLEGNDYIMVLGTLNAPRYSKSISPIFNTDMLNISELSNFEAELDTGIDTGYYRMGAYRKGVNVEQHDYLLASPGLFSKVSGSGMNRKAMWPTKRPIWETYESIQQERDSASEHPLLWVSLNLNRSTSAAKLSA